MRTLNLTQHNATPEQVAVGVFEPNLEDKKRISELLTFEEIPTCKDIEMRAEKLAEIATIYEPAYALIGGAPYLMSKLEKALRKRSIIPVYSFTKRVSEEKVQPDGTVVKTQVFRHLGFVFVGNE